MKSSSKFFLIFTSVMSFSLFYFLNRFWMLYISAEGSFFAAFSYAYDNILSSISQDPVYISLQFPALAAGAAGAAAVWLFYLYHTAGSKKYMHGTEHGSAEWGSKKDIVNFQDDKFENSIILTETENMTMNDRMKRTSDDDFSRNKNVLVIGSSGSGKTRFYVKPNIMQMHSSYVITDPKGLLFHECGKMLQDNGYEIKVFDLVNRESSDKYNPFRYLRTADDVLKLITNLMANTSSAQNKSEGDFWEKAETALLEAIFGYLLFNVKESDQTIANAMELLRMAEAKEEDEDYQSSLDIVFEDLEKKDPNNFAVKQYKIYKFAAGRTAKSILVSVGVRLAAFNIDSINRLVSGDTLQLDAIGDRKTALFVILPDTDKSFNFLAAMMFQQMFDILVYRADTEYRGRLPVPVRCMLDEFANIGQIPMFEILMSTVRSRGISLNIILQNLAQIKNLYKDTWEVITGNCDSLLFLGGTEQSTLKYISEMCGKQTIKNQSINESKGQSGSYSLNNQVLGRDLITSDEAGRLKGRECILAIRSCRPFKSRKYDIEKHKNYRLLSDYSEDNWFEKKDVKMLEDYDYMDVTYIDFEELESFK